MIEKKNKYTKEDLWNGFLVFYLFCILIGTLLISLEIFIKGVFVGTLLCLGIIGIISLLAVLKGILKLLTGK